MRDSSNTSPLTDKPIITVKEARKLLGKDGKNLADEEIRQLVVKLGAVIGAYFKTVNQQRRNYESSRVHSRVDRRTGSRN